MPASPTSESHCRLPPDTPPRAARLSDCFLAYLLFWRSSHLTAGTCGLIRCWQQNPRVLSPVEPPPSLSLDAVTVSGKYCSCWIFLPDSDAGLLWTNQSTLFFLIFLHHDSWKFRIILKRHSAILDSHQC